MKTIISLGLFCIICSNGLSTLGNAQEQPEINCLAYLQADKNNWKENAAISGMYGEIADIAIQLDKLHKDTFFETSDLWMQGKEDEARAIESAAEARAEPLRERLLLLREQREAEFSEAADRQDDAYYSAYVYPAPGWEVDVSGYDPDLVLILAKKERRRFCPAYVPQ